MATSRSLGVLTVDLIAKVNGFTQGMDAAERKADRTQRNISRQAKQSAKEMQDAWDKASKVIGASIAGITVGAVFQELNRVTKETAQLANEYQRLAVLSGTSAEGFQRLAAGAETVGISAEKLADIFKDVQDKAGDFAQTGGGGMADFFENIAPKVGVTIDQFRRLSGPEALQLYVSSLEKANLSQQDMTFYMEAVASDSALLLPLLRENGAEFERLGQAAQDAGAIMDSVALAAAKAYKEESQALEMAMKGLRIEIMEQALPALTDFNQQLADPAIQESIRGMISLLVKLATTVNDLGGEFLLGLKNSDGFFDALGKYGLTNPFKTAQDQLASLNKDLEMWEAKRANFVRLGYTGMVKTADEELRGLRQQIEYYSALDRRSQRRVDTSLRAMGLEGLETYGDATGGSTPLSAVVTKPKAGKTQAEKDAEAAAKFLKTLQEQVFKTQELTAYEKLHNDIKLQGLKLSSDQYDKAVGLATAIDMAAEAERARGATIQRNNALFEQQEKLTAKALEYELQLSAYGLGDAQAQRLQERIRLLQEQQAEMRKIENDRANALAGADSQSAADRVAEQYAQRLEIVRNAQAEELRLFDDFTAKKMEKDQSWILGFQNAVNTYIESSRNVYQAADRAVTSIFGSMEDALVSFVTTGKAGFKDFAASILADMARIAARSALSGLGSSILSGIGGLFGGATGGGGVDYSLSSGGTGGLGLQFGGFRATGGTVSPGSLYRVNENGPEMLSIGGADYLMTGNAAGYVTPNAALQGSSGGGLTVNVPVAVDLGGGQTDPAQAAAFSEQLATAVKSTVREEIVRSNMPGGTLWAMRNGRV